MAILTFLVVLFVLVLVHEFGHFAVAKLTGMRVDEFGIGFPPRLFGIKRGETTYSLNLFPIGGFVKILGENGGEEIGESDRARAFGARPKLAQAAVLVAGVAMNVLLAWVLFVVLFMVGTPSVVSESEATSAAVLTITDVLPDGPAAAAGIPVAATIEGVAAGDEQLEGTLTPNSFSSFIASHQGEAVTVVYLAEGKEKSAVLTPQQGVLPGSGDRVAVGIGLALVEDVPYSFSAAIKEGTVLTGTTLAGITVGLGGLIVDALHLHADFSSVAGPVGIVGLVGEASSYGFAALLMFTAFISLNLAVINLIPFPALDGGRLIMVLIEAVKGTPIRPQVAGTLNAFGFALLIFLMIAVTYNDILRIL